MWRWRKEVGRGILLNQWNEEEQEAFNSKGLDIIITHVSIKDFRYISKSILLNNIIKTLKTL